MKMTNENEIRKMLKEKYSLNEQAIEEIINIAYEKLEIFKSQNTTEEQLAKKFEIIITSMLIKRSNSNAKEYTGVFVEDSGIIMKNKAKIDKLLAQFENDPIKKEELLANETIKIINNVPTVCDNIKDYDGVPNKKFGKPLKVEEQRQLTGFAEINGERKRVILIAKNDALNEKIPLCELISFKAVAFGDSPIRMFLENNTVKSTNVEIEMLELLKEIYGEPKTIAEAEIYLNECIANGTFSQPVLIKGIIDKYNTSNKDALSIIVRDDISLDMIGEKVSQLFVKIDDTFDGEVYSECYITGRLWKVGDENNQLFGMTASAFVCDTKRIQTVELTEEDLDL